MHHFHDPDCALFLACANHIIHHCQGLHDRGTIEVGKRADLNLIDMQKLKIKHPEFIHDSTSGNDTPRWHQVRHFSTLQVSVAAETKRMFRQAVEGYTMTMVRGVPTYENGVATGNLPGRLVRSPSVMAGKQRTGLAPVPPEFSAQVRPPQTPTCWAHLAGLTCVRRQAVEAAAERSAESANSDALQRSLSSSSGGGISHQSRIATQLEEEAKKRQQAAKL